VTCKHPDCPAPLRADNKSGYCDKHRSRSAGAKASHKKYADTPERQEWLRQRRETRTAWIASLKRGKPCTDCKVSYPTYVMDWDHREGEAKEFNLAKAWSYSDARILAEIAKCDLVCANCHRIRTATRAGYAETV
jgi:hypothetical protein